MEGADGLRPLHQGSGYGYGRLGRADGTRLIVVVNGLEDPTTAPPNQKMLEWAFVIFETRILFAPTSRLAMPGVRGASARSSWPAASRSR